jgi:outer membrane usher protein
VSLGLGLFAPGALAQPADASKALFDQAFAQRRKSTVQQIALPTTLDGRDIGIVDAQIRGDDVWLSREVLMRLLKEILQPALQASLAATEPAGTWISTDSLKALGMEALYSPQSITLELKVPLDLRRTRVLRVDGRGIADADHPPGNILTPEPWSLIANTRWVATQTSTDSGTLTTGRVYLDGAQRLGPWVLEAAGSVPLSAASGDRTRDLTRLLRDWPAQAVRLSLGDLSTGARPGLPAVALGGLQLSRRFSLNPSLNPQSQPGDKLALPAGAAVDVRSNGFVTRTLQLPPGVYELKDIPVFTGANEVELLIVEPGGRTSVRRFDYFFDAALLAPGLSEFEFALGQPSQAASGGLRYAAGQPVANLGGRWGLLPGTTLGAAAQARRSATGLVRVLQAEGLWATRWGTALLYATSNRHPGFGGRSASLQWRWQSATQWGAAPGPWSWAVVAQTTRSSQGYAALQSDTASEASRDSGFRVSALVPGGLSATLSASFRNSGRATDSARVLGLSLRQTINRQWSLEGTLGGQRGGTGVSRFFTLGLRYSAERQADGTTGRASAAYQSQESRLQLNTEATGTATVLGADAPWRLLAGTARSDSGNETSLRAAMLSSRADVSAQLTDARAGSGGKSRLAEATLASTLLVSPGGWAVTRPVSDSAALIVPLPGYENLVMYVDPMLDRSAASSDRFGAPVLTDLNAYTPREIQLDVANLPPGRSLGVDRPLLQPGYRSVTVVPLGSNANVQLSGALMTAQGQPAALVALRLTPVGLGEAVDLFTSRRGRFTSPPLPPGRYMLVIPGDAKPLKQLQIDEGQAGLLDLGTLTMPADAP